jgi:hypothetical protein
MHISTAMEGGQLNGAEPDGTFRRQLRPQVDPANALFKIVDIVKALKLGKSLALELFLSILPASSTSSAEADLSPHTPTILICAPLFNTIGVVSMSIIAIPRPAIIARFFFIHE